MQNICPLQQFQPTILPRKQMPNCYTEVVSDSVLPGYRYTCGLGYRYQTAGLPETHTHGNNLLTQQSYLN
jgi:hypothetical protein